VRHGELVPAPIAPQAVHGVEHVQQRQVTVQRQAVPGGGAHLGKGHIGFHHVDVLDRAIVTAHEGTHQALAAALAAQVFQQRQQWALARVQGHVVEVVEHARVGQLAQFGVHKAAAQHGGDVRVARLDGLRDAERGVHRAGEGHRQQHHGGLVAGDGLVRELLQQRVHQRGRCGQGIRQRVERGLAACQRFGIAHKLETLVHRVAQHIGQVVQV